MTPIEETASRIYDHLAGLPSMQEEPVETEMIRTNTGEILGPITDDIVTPQLNKLRQQILSEWKGEQS